MSDQRQPPPAARPRHGEPPQPDPGAGTAQHAFAAALRHARGRRSQEQLAAWANSSREYVSKVELCRRWPSRDFAEQCDRVLDTGGVLARLWPDVEAERRAALAARRRRRRLATGQDQPRAPAVTSPRPDQGRPVPPRPFPPRPVPLRSPFPPGALFPAGVGLAAATAPVPGGTRTTAPVFETVVWPLVDLVSCRCGRRLQPYPATANRRFYRGGHGCSIGLLDADQLEDTIATTVADRISDRLTGHRSPQPPPGGRRRLLDRPSLRLLVRMAATSITVVDTGDPIPELCYRWLDPHAPPAGPVPAPAAVAACPPRWPQ